MNTSSTDWYALPYGTLGIRPEILTQLRLSNCDDLERPGAPVVVVNPQSRQLLRMHSLQHPFTLPPVAQDLAHAESQVAFLCQHLCKLCGNFAKPQQLFINRYFEELRLHVLSNVDSLQKKTEGLEGLIEINHWCFAAPMPLPRAHIYAPHDVTDQSFKQDDFILVDFAFWNGSQLQAVQIGNGKSLTNSRKKALARLEHAGILVQNLDNTTLNGSEPLSLLPALGDEFMNFLHDTAIPHSPFRGRAIEAPLTQDRSA